jgi:hypothetical protein
MRASSLVAAVVGHGAKFSRRKTLVAHSVGDWLNGGAKSPKEAIEKRRLKELFEV